MPNDDINSLIFIKSNPEVKWLTNKIKSCWATTPKIPTKIHKIRSILIK